MLHISGHNPLKYQKPKLTDIFKPSSQPQPSSLSKPEMLKALDLSVFELNADSNALLSKIEQEANKIHESLKKLNRNSRSPDKRLYSPSHDAPKSPHSSHYSNHNLSQHNDIRETSKKYDNEGHFNNYLHPDAYDSDPEYQHYRGFSEGGMRYEKALSEEGGRERSPLDYDGDRGNGHYSKGVNDEDYEETKNGMKERLDYKDYADYEGEREKNMKNKENLEKIDYREYADFEENQTKTFNLTVPKPFRFESREISKPTAISKRRFLDDIEERKTREKSIRNHRFRATPIPEHIKDRSLFSKITHEQEKRRAEVKKNSKILTLQREKPFSFYLRDLKASKKTPAERKVYQFQANPIPWFCSVPLLQIMNEKGEAERRERVAKEAQFLMEISHLPSRMEKHEQEKRVKELKGFQNINQGNAPQPFPFQPIRRKPVPEFARLQANFQELLDRKRSNKRPIVPKPFDFTASKRAQKREYLDQENLRTKEAVEIHKKTVYVAKMPEIQPPSTKKWEQAYELNKKRQEITAQKVIEEEKKAKERERKKKEIEMRVKASPAIVDNRKALEEKKRKTIEGKKEEIKRTEETYKHTLEEINDRVRKRLLLVENYEEGSRKARKKKLAQSKI